MASHFELWAAAPEKMMETTPGKDGGQILMGRFDDPFFDIREGATPTADLTEEDLEWALDKTVDAVEYSKTLNGFNETGANLYRNTGLQRDFIGRVNPDGTKVQSLPEGLDHPDPITVVPGTIIEL